MKKILLIVDPQNDFIDGTLAVAGAEERMKALAEALKAEAEYDWIGITLDSHPMNHCSFKNNGGIWPVHCVCQEEGWKLPTYLEEALRTRPDVRYFRKGTLADKEEYSIFDNAEDGSNLREQLIALTKEETVCIELCGIAGDYCVLETLQGLRTFVDDTCIQVRLEFTASIDGGEKLKTYLSTIKG